MKTLNIYELPADKRQKALEIATKIVADPRLHSSFNGKRLNYDRNIVSVPLNGGSFRLLFRDLGPSMEFCGAATHAQYDHLISSKNGDSVKPMEIIAAQPKLVAFMPKPEPEPAPVASVVVPAHMRKQRNNQGTKNARDWVANNKVGIRFTSTSVAGMFNISTSAARSIIEDMEKAGRVQMVKLEDHLRIYARVEDEKIVRADQPLTAEAPVPEVSLKQDPVALHGLAAQLDVVETIACIEALLANLKCKARPVPCTLDTFSDDDLTLEIHRRMSARKAA